MVADSAGGLRLDPGRAGFLHPRFLAALTVHVFGKIAGPRWVGFCNYFSWDWRLSWLGGWKLQWLPWLAWARSRRGHSCNRERAECLMRFVLSEASRCGRAFLEAVSLGLCITLHRPHWFSWPWLFPGFARRTLPSNRDGLFLLRNGFWLPLSFGWVRVTRIMRNSFSSPVWH